MTNLADSALILVDLQKDFLPGGALAVARGGEVILVANRLIPKFGLVVATRDWHPVDHGSFAANHSGKQPGDCIQLDGLDQTLWPVHCVRGTAGAEFADGLLGIEKTKVFSKGTDATIDSYSGFFDNGHRHATGLGDFLSEQRVSRIYAMGLATEYCVKFTVLDARRLGFEAYLVSDGCRAVNLAPGDDRLAIEEMRRAGARIVTSEKV